MRKGEHRDHLSITGVLVVGDWAENGNEREVFIVTDDDEEFLLISRMNLARIAGAEVEVTGTVCEDSEQDSIVLTSLRVIDLPKPHSAAVGLGDLFDDEGVPLAQEPFCDQSEWDDGYFS